MFDKDTKTFVSKQNHFECFDKHILTSFIFCLVNFCYAIYLSIASSVLIGGAQCTAWVDLPSVSLVARLSHFDRASNDKFSVKF